MLRIIFMLKKALFYILQHPTIKGTQRIDYSYFPTTQRLADTLKKIHSKQLTPVFVADMKIVHQRLQRVENTINTLWKKSVIAYSFKTNYAFIPQFYQLGVHAEVTSERELLLALRAGYRGEKIIFNGPYKTRRALRLAWKHKVCIQIDNVEELFMIDEMARFIHMPLIIGCRVNLIGRGLPISHFGMYERELFDPKVIELLRTHRYLRFEGIHFHVGSDIEDASIFERAATNVGRILRILQEEGLTVKYVNFGGGVMSHGMKPHDNNRWKPYEFEEYARVLWNAMHKECSFTANLTVKFEPGRYLVDDATVFVTRVLRVKINSIKQTVFVDGTTAMYPLAHYRPQILRVHPFGIAERSKFNKPTVIYGASCREIDTLYKGWLSGVSPGDLIVFYCAGAYNQTLGSDFIFSKPRTYFLLD